MRQSGSASTAELKEIKEEAASLRADDKEHRGQAQDSREYHLQCTAKSKQDMDKIQELQKVVNVSEHQREELRVLKHNLKHT